MFRYACSAVRLKTGVVAPPVMPGAAANDAGVSNSVTATISARNRVLNVSFFMFIGLIAALLVAGVPERIATGDAVADMNFRHQTTEILGVVGEVIELGGVEIE